MPHAGKALRNRAEVDMLDGFTAEMLARVQFAFTVSFLYYFSSFFDWVGQLFSAGCGV